jgi:carboxyl-terminal processing protease
MNVKNRFFKAACLLTPVVLLLSYAAPAQAADGTEEETSTYELLNLFGDVLERIRSDYVEAPEDKDLIEAAIGGMLASLDPHSSYMNADTFKEMQVQTKGEFGGLGIEVSMDNGLIKVVSPIDDTPAFRAGLQPGDYITHLDGEPVLGLTLNDAVDRMRGKVGEDITLSVRRIDEDPFDVTVTRAIIKIESVRSRLEGDIGYIRITSFSGSTDKSLMKSIKKLNDQREGEDLTGIVLDLRNNPGGLLDQAIKISDAFLGKGEIVSTRGKRAEDTERFNAREGDVVEGLPMVVLINSGSASASEIVSGALQDHGRAIVMGTQSFGKGLVQTIIPLGKHGAMRLTTARYYTPSGRDIQKIGIEPDIIVEQARLENVKSGTRRREADLRGALDNAGGTDDGGTDDDGTETDDNAESPSEIDSADTENDTPEDYQLSRALDLLNGYLLFSDMMMHNGG